MIKGNIVKLHDEDLAEISGGGEEFNPVNESKKAAIDESVKFGIGIVAVPVGALLTKLAVWFAETIVIPKLNKKVK